MHFHQPSATAKTHMIPLHFPHGHPRGRTPLHTLCGIVLDTESQVDGPADCEWCLEVAQDIVKAMTPDFECQAYISHGPGHQSRTRCERHTPHPIEGEHWARDPMCPGFEWEGAKGSTGF